MKNILIVLLFPILFISFTVRQTVANQNIKKKPKNIILFIGDGMGYNQIKACDYYYDEVQPYEKWENQFWVSTYPFGSSYNSDSVWTFYNYVKTRYTDSAPAATAMATGTKTYDDVIGLDYNYYRVENLCELAKKFNKSTGVITSVPIPHATPAGFLTHVVNRNYFHSIIAQMIIESKADVIMGCGNPDWDNNGTPKTKESDKYFYPSIWKEIKAGNIEMTDETGIKRNIESCDGDNIPDKWFLCERLSTFDSIAKGLFIPKRLLGVPQVYETLQYERNKIDKEANPYDSPFISSVPSLSTMLNAGLNVLKKNNNGFFLMVEGGAIDWACHDANSIHMIEEVNEFNKAVSSAIDWVNIYSNWEETIIIVVADHETGYLTGKNINDKNYKTEKLQLENNGKMKMPGMQFNNMKDKDYYGHSNSLVPIFVKGNGSMVFTKYMDETDLVRGKYIQNNEIGLAIKELIKTIDIK